jgi:hypothetical protein
MASAVVNSSVVVMSSVVIMTSVVAMPPAIKTNVKKFTICVNSLYACSLYSSFTVL